MKKIALITNPFNEQGRALCEKLADLDYRIAIAYPVGVVSAAWLADSDNKSKVEQYSCANESIDSVRICLDALENNLGALALMVNNGNVVQPQADLTPSDYSLARTEIFSDFIFNLASVVSARMTARGAGCIVNIASSDRVLIGGGREDALDMHAITRVLQQKVGTAAVTVNTISIGVAGMTAPGTIAIDAMRSTEQKQSNQILTHEEEVAALVAYMASEDGAELTGANIVINRPHK